MKSVGVAFTVLMLGVIYCEDELCVEADGCYVDIVDPKWVLEMNEAFTKQSLEVKVKEIVKITRTVEDDGTSHNKVHTKALTVAEDGRNCNVTWVESAQRADDSIPVIDINCESDPETKPPTIQLIESEI